MKTKDSITEIKNILKKANHAWSSGHPEKLDEYFHNDIVIVSHEMKVLGEGKKACIQSYVDFLSRASVTAYTDTDPEVRIFENTAIAFYGYDVSWIMDNKEFHEIGNELYILNHSKDKWQIVMRKLMPK